MGPCGVFTLSLLSYVLMLSDLDCCCGGWCWPWLALLCFCLLLFAAAAVAVATFSLWDILSCVSVHSLLLLYSGGPDSCVRNCLLLLFCLLSLLLLLMLLLSLLLEELMFFDHFLPFSLFLLHFFIRGKNELKHGLVGSFTIAAAVTAVAAAAASAIL